MQQLTQTNTTTQHSMYKICTPKVSHMHSPIFHCENVSVRIKLTYYSAKNLLPSFLWHLVSFFSM